MRGQIYNVKPFNGSLLITFLTNEDVMGYIDTYGGEQLDIDISLHRENRSLPQNQLAWKIAEAIGHSQRISKNEVMEHAMMDYGYSVYLPAQEKDLPMLQEVFKKIIDRGEVELTTPSGKQVKCHQLQCWKSTKLYNSEEFSVLIDGLIQMAKDEGVKVEFYEEYLKQQRL